MNVHDNLQRSFMNEDVTVKRYEIARMKRKVDEARAQRENWKRRAEDAELALKTIGTSFWQRQLTDTIAGAQAERTKLLTDLAALQQVVGGEVLVRLVGKPKPGDEGTF